MVEADFSGNFLNTENANEGDVIVVVGKPSLEEKIGTFGNYLATNIPVEINGKQKVYTPSRDSGVRLVAAWGKEMDAWVGKKAKVSHVKTKLKGETKVVIEVFPIVEQK